MLKEERFCLKYKCIIVDFDGTVYPLLPVQVCMGIWMVLYYLFHLLRINELFAVLLYRNLLHRLVGQSFPASTVESFYERISVEYALSKKEVEVVTKRWLERNPCVFIRFFQRTSFLKKLMRLQRDGKIIVLYSDNPLKIKKDCILLKADYYFDGFQKEILCMKPCANGLSYIMDTLGVKQNEVVVIGDKIKRDGLCAMNAGVDYISFSDLGEYNL